MSRFSLSIAAAVAALLCGVIFVTTFERPPVLSSQGGFRGLSMGDVQNPRTIPARLAANQVPEAPEAAETDGPKAHETYENVQVLRDLSAAQFNRLMIVMTEWIAPNQGCGYCHNVENMASDEVYTKVVARRMLQMTHKINSEWATHVGQTGVTCYTCHRGNPVPTMVWSTEPNSRAGLQAPRGQNHPASSVGESSLPSDPFTPFLLGEQQIRNISATSLPGRNSQNIMTTEWTYGLMMHMSTSLGVNCTHCHNSRSFAEWAQSPPARTTAWHGIRMVRDINMSYIEPLKPVWAQHPNGPAEGPHGPRLGAMGDPLKVNCSTCHQGVNRPLNGAPMLRDFPELKQVNQGPLRSADSTPR